MDNFEQLAQERMGSTQRLQSERRAALLAESGLSDKQKEMLPNVKLQVQKEEIFQTEWVKSYALYGEIKSKGIIHEIQLSKREQGHRHTPPTTEYTGSLDGVELNAAQIGQLIDFYLPIAELIEKMNEVPAEQEITQAEEAAGKERVNKLTEELMGL